MNVAFYNHKANRIIPDVVPVMSLFEKGKLRTSETGNTMDAYDVCLAFFTVEDIHSKNSFSLFKVRFKILESLRK